MHFISRCCPCFIGGSQIRFTVSFSFRTELGSIVHRVLKNWACGMPRNQERARTRVPRLPPTSWERMPGTVRWKSKRTPSRTTSIALRRLLSMKSMTTSSVTFPHSNRPCSKKRVSCVIFCENWICRWLLSVRFDNFLFSYISKKAKLKFSIFISKDAKLIWKVKLVKQVSNIKRTVPNRWSWIQPCEIKFSFLYFRSWIQQSF